MSYPINANHEWDWFINALLSLTRMSLTQQNIDTLKDALEKETRIEAMEGYPHEHWGGPVSNNPTLVGLHHKIAD